MVFFHQPFAGSIEKMLKIFLGSANPDMGTASGV
jgi:hypothetical protein